MSMAIDPMSLAERRQAIRRLVALCHEVNRLVDLAEADSSAPLADQAHTIRRLLQDLVLDLIATTRPAPRITGV